MKIGSGCSGIGLAAVVALLTVLGSTAAGQGGAERAGRTVATDTAPNTPAQPTTTLSTNLHRVGLLLDGDARAVWIGDSWCRLNFHTRLPFGAIAIWPGLNVTAASAGFKTGNRYSQAMDYTSGDGGLVDINALNAWQVETNGGSQTHFGLPMNDLTMLFGAPGLVIPQSGNNAHKISWLRLSYAGWVLTDNGPFSTIDDNIMARAWYYSPLNPSDMVGQVVLHDTLGAPLLSFSPATEARALWSLGGDPSLGLPAAAVPSQMNAAYLDVPVAAVPNPGPGLRVLEDPAFPIASSEQYWFFGGMTLYKTDEFGNRLPGYYHSGLSQDSWSVAGFADDTPSNGGKNFSDEQLTRWLDITTIDRQQTPVVIMHIATENLSFEQLLIRMGKVLDRFRAAFAAICTTPPRFLLVGSYMHKLPGRTLAESRTAIGTFDAVYASLAASEPDCSFYSIYNATDGVFFTTDQYGGQGAQQLARDWLDANGFATITFGGTTYNLSTADNGGVDGVFINDGLHIKSIQGAAFYAKLLGDAIATARCPGDFNSDGIADTRDVIAFLSAWAAGDMAADFNGDGDINTLDVIAFLNAWQAGC